MIGKLYIQNYVKIKPNRVCVTNRHSNRLNNKNMLCLLIVNYICHPHPDGVTYIHINTKVK